MNSRLDPRPLNQSAPSVLIVAAKWWPLSARLATCFVRAGWRYSGTKSIESIRQALIDCDSQLVVPCDDGVVTQLHALYAQDLSLRVLIERSLGPLASYPVVTSRVKLMQVARDLGVAVPRFQRIAEQDDLVRWHANIAAGSVVKVDGESGGNGVRISHSFRESVIAWKRFRAPASYFADWKRLAIDRDPLALWNRKNSVERQVCIQEFIPGRPANSMIACQNGEVLGIDSVAVVASDGPIGASTIVRRIHNETMARAARLIAGRLQLNGFYGLDFIIRLANQHAASHRDESAVYATRPSGICRSMKPRRRIDRALSRRINTASGNRNSIRSHGILSAGTRLGACMHIAHRGELS